MRRWNALVAVALVCGMLAVPALAGATTTGSDCWWDHGHHGDCTISAADFLTLAAQSNRFEIETGQLAQQRAESTTVRDLGAMFAQEHTAQLQQITDLAVTLRVTLPEGLGPRYQLLADQLGTLSGAAFDRAWLKIQWRVHQEALALLLRGAICGDTPEVQALAQGALPPLSAPAGRARRSSHSRAVSATTMVTTTRVVTTTVATTATTAVTSRGEATSTTAAATATATPITSTRKDGSAVPADAAGAALRRWRSDYAA
jgi:putative membrane protein